MNARLMAMDAHADITGLEEVTRRRYVCHSRPATKNISSFDDLAPGTLPFEREASDANLMNEVIIFL